MQQNRRSILHLQLSHSPGTISETCGARDNKVLGSIRRFLERAFFTPLPIIVCVGGGVVPRWSVIGANRCHSL